MASILELTAPCPRCRVPAAHLNLGPGASTYMCSRCEWSFTMAPGSPSTTLNGATSIGATSATLTSATGFTPVNAMQIDTAGNAETAMPEIAGNVLSFGSSPLTKAHSNGAAVAAVTGTNSLPGVRSVPPVSPYLSGA